MVKKLLSFIYTGLQLYLKTWKNLEFDNLGKKAGKLEFGKSLKNNLEF